MPHISRTYNGVTYKYGTHGVHVTVHKPRVHIHNLEAQAGGGGGGGVDVACLFIGETFYDQLPIPSRNRTCTYFLRLEIK